MKACERYLNAIQELADGTLGPIRRAELELHLESCDACRALAEDLQAIVTAAESLDPLTPPERIWQQISGRLRAEARASGSSPTMMRRHSVAIAGARGGSRADRRRIAVFPEASNARARAVDGLCAGRRDAGPRHAASHTGQRGRQRSRPSC